MAFFDFDFGSLLGDIGEGIADIGTDLVSDIEFSDIASIASVGAGIYFQSKSLQAQEDAIARQAASINNQLTPDSLANEESVTIDIGASDIITEEDAVREQEEQQTNTGRVELDKTTTPKKKKPILSLGKLGSTVPQIGANKL